MYLAKPRKLANGPIPPQWAARTPGLLAVMCCAAGLQLAGCSSSTDAPRPASPTTYPDLASVPPRPTPTDTLAERHALQAQLVEARRNADFRAAELAYETGRAAAPPVPPTAPAAAATAVEPPPRVGGDGAVARAYLDSTLNDVRDRGKLRQFMRRLGREAPDPFGPQTLAQAVGLAATPPPPKSTGSSTPSADPEPGTPEYFGDFLRGALGIGDDAPVTPPD